MNKKFGEVVRQERESKGLSQHHLAYLCNTSVPNLKKVEEDKVTPRDTTVAKLAMHLDLDLMETLILTPHFSNDMSELAKIVKIARLKKGLSCKDLAQKTGFSITKIHDFEISKTIVPLLSSLKKLATVLDLNPTILNEAAGYTLSDDTEEIGSIIKNFRIQNNLSLSDCALLCDILPQSLSKIESGKTKRPSKRFLKNFSTYANIDLSLLLIKSGWEVI